ncbi:MAG: hypothetical protein J5892_03345 [Bacilli bacterium]|nr:hypothetical protein [Bacilli bacterium]
MICPKCGKDGFGKFCKECGTKMPVKEKVSPGIKRLDIFLKLGVFMVLVAGLILATSNYEFISDIVKVLLLILISIVFFGLTIISSLFIKIRSTTKSYLLIAFLFSIFSIVGIGYFEIFDDLFSFHENPEVVLSVIFGLNLIYMLLYDIFFKSRFAKILGGISLFCFSISFISIFDLNLINSTLILGIFYLLLTIIAPKRGYLYGISIISNYLFYLLVVISINTAEFSLLAFIAGMLVIVNTIVLTIKDRRRILVVLNVIATYLVAFAVAHLFGKNLGDYDLINVGLVLFIYIFYYLFTKIFNKKNEDVLFKANQVIAFIFSIFLVLDNVDLNCAVFFITTLAVLLINILSSITSKSGVYSLFRPLIIIANVIAIVNIFDYYLIDVSAFSALVIISFISLLAHFIARKESIKGLYLAVSLVLISFNIIGNIVTSDISKTTLLIQLIGLLTAFITYVYSLIKGNKNKGYIFIGIYSLITYLFMLSIIFMKHDFMGIGVGIGAIICYIVTLINYFIPFKNKANKFILTVYSIIPFAVMIDQLNLNSNLNDLLLSLYLILDLFMVILPINKKQSLLKHILFIIFITIIIIIDIYAPGIYLSILAGVTSLGLIIYSLVQKKYTTAYFIIGIITSILNLMYALKDVWREVPFWLYLLFGGLVVIVLCTVLLIKEANKNKTN